jgi:hypothetical protein
MVTPILLLSDKITSPKTQNLDLIGIPEKKKKREEGKGKAKD